MTPLTFFLIIIFGPMLLLMGGFFLLVGKLAKKASADVWEGEVVDKSHNTKDEDDNKTAHFYALIIRTTKGEQRKIPVMSEVYKAAKVGDKYVKEKGKLNPRKVSV